MPIETIPSQSTRLLPAISTEGFLDTGGEHRIWWAQGGSNTGFPVCIVHGGPGGRSRLESAQWFTPSGAKWHLLDQRGCGKSTPTGALGANTLNDLLADMEALRVTHGIEHWGICGGSWGALVALRYAIAYPQRVSGLLFRSPFLGTLEEIDSFFERMPQWLGPEGRRIAKLRAGTAGLRVLQKLASLLHGDTEEAITTARMWDAFETDMASPRGESRAALKAWLDNQAAISAASGLLQKFRVQAHYLSNGCFLEADWVEQIRGGWIALQNLPVEIVQGDSDVVCPPGATQSLLEIFPKAAVTWVSGVGHDMGSPMMRDALTLAATRLVSRAGDGATTLSL